MRAQPALEAQRDDYDEVSGVVLVVDEDAEMRRATAKILKRCGHNTCEAESLAAAREALAQRRFDLLVLEPGAEDGAGLELVHELEQDRTGTAVLVLSADASPAMLRDSLSRGVDSFLSKPVDPLTLETQVRVVLLQRRLSRSDRVRRAPSFEELRHVPRRLLERLCGAWDLRHVETGAHVRRIARYSETLALARGYPADAAKTLGEAAMIHDIGKLAIPDEILKKPCKLTVAEFEIMKQHPTIGAEMLEGFQDPFLDLARTIALRHHERWDGSGYPGGLRETECPESARIVAIVDVFDALGQQRCYKAAWAESELVKFFRRSSDTLFEPVLVEALLDCISSFRRIADALPDNLS